jgi:hypothetical protein
MILLSTICTGLEIDLEDPLKTKGKESGDPQNRRDLLLERAGKAPFPIPVIPGGQIVKTRG